MQGAPNRGERILLCNSTLSPAVPKCRSSPPVLLLQALKAAGVTDVILAINYRPEVRSKLHSGRWRGKRLPVVNRPVIGSIALKFNEKLQLLCRH